MIYNVWIGILKENKTKIEQWSWERSMTASQPIYLGPENPLPSPDKAVVGFNGKHDREMCRKCETSFTQVYFGWIWAMFTRHTNWAILDQDWNSQTGILVCIPVGPSFGLFVPKRGPVTSHWLMVRHCLPNGKNDGKSLVRLGYPSWWGKPIYVTKLTLGCIVVHPSSRFTPLALSSEWVTTKPHGMVDYHSLQFPKNAKFGIAVFPR